MTSSITAGASAGSREIGSAVQKFAAVSTVVVVSTGRELSVKGIIGLFGAAVVASLYVSAFAQAPPPGSYQDSCRDIRMRGTTLTAVCSRFNGSEQLTALNVARCVGDIGNADGQLICNGGQPAEPVADRCGDVDVWNLTSHIYVSPKGTDSDSCGASPSSPCGSIQRGIDRCGAKGCGVLVRYGLYSLTEPIRLREGVSVYGRCVFDGDSDRKYRSVIVAPPDGKPGIIADKILLRTVLDGVFVRGSDATSPGGASIAMTISNSIFRNPGPVGLAIAHTILSSGWGANGAPGQTSPGNSGEGGAYGPIFSGPGGGGRACPSSSSSLPGRGGDGGPGTGNYSTGCFIECDCSNTNDPKGQVGQDSGDAKGGGVGGGGHPGRGCSGAGHETVGDGGQGDPGNPGSCGKVGGTTTADIWGTFPGTDWRPGLGGSGVAGSTGSGGGGGGGGGAYVYMTRDSHWHDVYGMPGGGAGGGGCGGPGGQGGQQGGASFPIVIYSSTFDSGLTDGYLTLVPGPGGQGGAGAIGGQGGPGGSGGNGGSGHYDALGGPGSGGPGGAGGQGGAGSGGAGGNGGPSVGVAFVSSHTQQLGPSVSIYASQPGTGGAGGAGGKNDPKQCHGAKGSDGLAGGTGSIHDWY